MENISKYELGFLFRKRSTPGWVTRGIPMSPKISYLVSYSVSPRACHSSEFSSEWYQQRRWFTDNLTVFRIFHEKPQGFKEWRMILFAICSTVQPLYFASMVFIEFLHIHKFSEPTKLDASYYGKESSISLWLTETSIFANARQNLVGGKSRYILKTRLHMKYAKRHVSILLFALRVPCITARWTFNAIDHNEKFWCRITATPDFKD